MCNLALPRFVSTAFAREALVSGPTYLLACGKPVVMEVFRNNAKSLWCGNLKEVPGQLYSVEKPTAVRPDRLVVIGYTVSKWEKLYDHQCEDLMDLGFVLPERAPKIRMFGRGDPRPPVPPIPSGSTMVSTQVPDTGTTAVSGASFLGPGSSSDSTLQRPQSEDHMDVSSSTWG